MFLPAHPQLTNGRTFGLATIKQLEAHMKDRYRMLRRGKTFYAHDCKTGLRESLQTSDKVTARRLILAKNEAFLHPLANVAMAITRSLAQFKFN